MVTPSTSPEKILLAPYCFRKYSENAAGAALVVDGRAAEENAECQHIYGVLFEDEEQVFAFAMNVRNQPKKREQQDPEQQGKNRPTLLASEIDCDQQNRFH